MDSWQAWAAAAFSFMLAVISYNSRRDKQKLDKLADGQAKLEIKLTERITRVEAEVMTEREVREILQEFLQPMQSSLLNIERDVVDVKIKLAGKGG